MKANEVVDRVLDSSIVRLLVAGDANNTDRIAGWIAYVPSDLFVHGRIVVYVYTRDQYRRHGVAKALIVAAFPTSRTKFFHMFNGPDLKNLLGKDRSSQHVSIEELLA